MFTLSLLLLYLKLNKYRKIKRDIIDSAMLYNYGIYSYVPIFTPIDNQNG